MVPGAGLEPAQPEGREILSLLCLPIPPPGHRARPRGLQWIHLQEQMNGGASRSRTGLRGFAIQCITALLSRLKTCVLIRVRLLLEGLQQSSALLSIGQSPQRFAIAPENFCTDQRELYRKNLCSPLTKNLG